LTISAFSPILKRVQHRLFKEKLHSAIYTHEFSGQALKDWDLFTVIENSDYPSNVGSFTIPSSRDGKVISTFTTLEE
jgi:hypothetical protein